jgi:hypothetical protein
MAAPSRPAAHEIPASVVVQAIVRPVGQKLRLLVRVPLTSMRDVTYPVREPGYVQIAASQATMLEGADLWIAQYVRVYEDGRPLPRPKIVSVMASLPSDDSWESYEAALAHVTGPPLPEDTELILEQGLLDVLLETDITSEASRFSIEPEWAHLGGRTSTVLRFIPPGQGERAFHYSGNPGVVRLDPRWHQAAWTFVKLGFLHILDGIDHLLFVLCLVIPFRRFVPLVAIVTSFTVAHSITLGASAFGLAPDALWFPPLIEVLIAASIVFMALENIVGAKLERRWLIAFGFGLVHGFGFSFALQESLQFAGAHLVTSLLAFNVGVELGQILVLAVAVPALALLFHRVVAERMGTIILSALVAHTAWHWMAERWTTLREFPFAPPTLDALFFAALMRWAMLALILVGVGWTLAAVLGRVTRRTGQADSGAANQPGEPLDSPGRVPARAES